MTALPHLTRRDGVYYWRRKVRPLSTTICDLRVSLRTTDRARATILCRVLSAESEPMMAALEQDRITLGDTPLDSQTRQGTGDFRQRQRMWLVKGT